eukprot:TRINITY_DN50015_c0_g1_i1.p1 TRINITY_DN50015_c0_g1~~TRINITY_DN50015_c0_g1_i1.p1  ORF type:complete len:571 (+),score=77.40 TRINITY_DN50015_c0_g1_i1:37-1713(+)
MTVAAIDPSVTPPNCRRGRHIGLLLASSLTWRCGGKELNHVLGSSEDVWAWADVFSKAYGDFRVEENLGESLRTLLAEQAKEDDERWKATASSTRPAVVNATADPRAKDGDDDVPSFYRLIGAPVERLEAEAYNRSDRFVATNGRATPGSEAIIRRRLTALVALLEHRPNDTAVRKTITRLESIVAVFGARGWRHYSPTYHPFKSFLNSPVARQAAAASGGGSGRGGGSGGGASGTSDIATDAAGPRMPDRDLALFAVPNFLNGNETERLAGMARAVFPRFPTATACFMGSNHMRAVLAAAGASSLYTAARGDLIPGSFCVGSNVSAQLLTTSGLALGQMPMTLIIEEGESALLDDVALRIERKLGLLRQNGGPFLLVKYEDGAHYMEHTDCSLALGTAAAKPTNPSSDRWATVLISLNDVNDGLEGGETDFPEVEASFTPRAGRALAWWNIDPRTGRCDQRTTHVARHVHSGTKLILMRWYTYFPGRGSSRKPAPELQVTVPFRPAVQCDLNSFESREGTLSCRWYSSMSSVSNPEGSPKVDAMYRRAARVASRQEL